MSPADTIWSRGIIQQIRSDQSLSRVRLFATPWIAARQASLSITNSRSSLRLMSIESMMSSSHLILCHPLLLLPPLSPSIRVFSNESNLRMRLPKYQSFSFSIIPSKEIPGLISFRMDWLDLLAVQGTLNHLYHFFIDFIYKGWRRLLLYLTYFVQYDDHQVHSCRCKRHCFIPFNGWVIFHCICVTCCRILRADLQSCRISGEEAWVAYGLRWLGKASFPEDNWTQWNKLRRLPEPLSRTFKVLLTWEGTLSLNSLIPYTSFPKHITLSWNHLFMHPFPCQLMSWGPCFSAVISLPPCTVPVNAEQVHLGDSGRAGAGNQTKPEQGFLSHQKPNRS